MLSRSLGGTRCYNYYVYEAAEVHICAIVVLWLQLSVPLLAHAMHALRRVCVCVCVP